MWSRAACRLPSLSEPPWHVPPRDLPLGAANDAALLLYLAGDAEVADDCCGSRSRYLSAERRDARAIQRLSIPGLWSWRSDRRTSSPRVDWLVERDPEPDLPEFWAVHRALCALILAERGHEEARELASAGLRLSNRSAPSERVRSWLVPRLEALASSGDRRRQPAPGRTGPTAMAATGRTARAALVNLRILRTPG